MTYPAPLPGLVIRYSFLWSREAKAGSLEGRKDRPCAIIVAVPQAGTDGPQVAVVPVTHSPPAEDAGGPATSLELPGDVRAALDLGPERSWVGLDELNVFVWPGYDLRVIPGTDTVSYGVLPQPLFERIRRGVIALDQARKTRQVGRG